MLPSYAPIEAGDDPSGKTHKPGRAGGGIGGLLRRLDAKSVLAAVFVLANLTWFLRTMLISFAPHANGGHRPHHSHHVYGHQKAGGSWFGGTNAQHTQHHPQHVQHASAAMPAAHDGAAVSSVVDLVATGSISSGAVKLAGDVLSSTSGRLLVSAGAVGVGTSLLDSSDKLVVNGPLRLADGGTKPECDTNRRGMIWHEFGDLGTADTVEVCVKLADETFAWRLAVGGGGGGGGSQ